MKRLMVFILLISITPGVMADSIENLKQIITDINDASSVDDLYTCRMNLKRIEVSNPLPVEELQLWYQAYQKMSRGFSRYNHYRNSVGAFKYYLLYNEKFLVQNVQTSIDSLNQAHKAIQKSESAKIEHLENEIIALEKNHENVSDMKTAYYTWGGIISILLLLVLIYLVYSKQNQIKIARQKLLENREHIFGLSTGLVHASLLEGGRALSKTVSLEGMSLLTDLFNNEEKSTEDSSKLNFDDKAIQNVYSEFDSLSKNS